VYQNRQRFLPQFDELLPHSLRLKLKDRQGQPDPGWSVFLRRHQANIHLFGGDLKQAEAVENAWEQFRREHGSTFRDKVGDVAIHASIYNGGVGLLHGHLYWRLDPDKATQLADRFRSSFPDSWGKFTEHKDWDAQVERVRRIRQFFPAEAFASPPKKDPP
jgi:hypothetical protein